MARRFKLHPINLTIPKHEVAKFKQAAKAIFPRECFAYLLGHWAGTGTIIEQIYLPNHWHKLGNKVDIHVPDEVRLEAIEHAAEEHLTLIGDIHSHCWEYASVQRCKKRKESIVDRNPSEYDWDMAAEDKALIMGICGVLELRKRPRMLRSFVRFWGPIVPVNAILV